MIPDTPRSAAAIITDQCGRILMHLRDDTPGVAWPGYWAVPAGACEPGENERDAIVRELREEAGLVVADLARLFEIEDTDDAGRRLTVFAGSWSGDESTLALTEGVRLQFFHPADLPALPVPPFLRDAITRALPTQPRLWADENEPIGAHWT
jgi:8-oxo-dGTP diphosphatase